jgi:hypothetical protein
MTPKRKPKVSTSLWTVVESMQRKLEGEGLDDQVVDVAVTRGLVALLGGHRRRRADRPSRPLWLGASRLADA